MGQRCSCLFNKPENEVFFKREDYNKCDDQFNDNIQVREYPEDYISNKQDDKKLEKIGVFIEICGIIIFKHILNKIRIYSLVIKDDQDNIKKLFNLKVFEKFESYYNSLVGEYNKEGWRKFYPDFDDKFNFDYEKLKKVELINKNEYYDGYVNLNGEKHGYGVLVTIDLIKYQGFWFNNIFSGWNRKIDSNGNIYEGLFIDGILNGKGIQRMQNDYNYIGDFQSGLKHGKGKEDSSEYTYDGDFVNDIKEGKGEIYYKITNNYYRGDFTSNLKNGIGFFKWSNGDIYEGEYIDNKKHGKGMFKSLDGIEYIGEYKNDVREGYGCYKWKNGFSFQGPFKNNKPHGEGKMTTNNKTIDVEFIEGVLNRKFKKK